MKNKNKLICYNLMLEVTRRCNLQCEHCMRGEAQNIDMPTKILKKALTQFDEIFYLTLTGGDPFLAPQVIEELVSIIINNKMKVVHLSLVENGTVLNDAGIRCIRALNKLGEYIYTDVWNKSKPKEIDTPVSISISEDEFHDNNIHAAIEFYNKYANQYLTIGSQGDWEVNFQNKNAKTIKMRDIKNHKWVKTGRAKENNNISYGRYTSHKHKLVYNNDTKILYSIQICANGNIVPIDSISFEEMDKYNLGNVMDNIQISDMINSWNSNEVLSQREITQYCKNKSLLNNSKIPSDVKIKKSIDNYYLHAKRILTREVYTDYPYLTDDESQYLIVSLIAILFVNISLDEQKDISLEDRNSVEKNIINYVLSRAFNEECNVNMSYTDLENIVINTVKLHNERVLNKFGFWGYLDYIKELNANQKI